MFFALFWKKNIEWVLVNMQAINLENVFFMVVGIINELVQAQALGGGDLRQCGTTPVKEFIC